MNCHNSAELQLLIMYVHLVQMHKGKANKQTKRQKPEGMNFYLACILRLLWAENVH